MNCTCGVCKFTKIWFCTCKSTRFFVSCRQDGEQMFFQVQILGTNNLFCLQNNVFVTLLHATQKLKSHFEARIFSLPQMVFIVQSKFIWGPSPSAQFIDTHFHVTSRNQGSFSKQEREPWERGWVSCITSVDGIILWLLNQLVNCVAISLTSPFLVARLCSVSCVLRFNLVST